MENCETKVLLDTGSSISMVPIEYVPEYKRTDMSSLISFAGKASQRLQLGVCDFLLDGKIFSKRVALVINRNTEEPCIFSCDIHNPHELQLMINLRKAHSVNQVMTRKQAQLEKSNLDPVLVSETKDDVTINVSESPIDTPELSNEPINMCVDSDGDDEMSMYGDGEEEMDEQLPLRLEE